MKKILDILIIVLLTILVMNLFSNKAEQTATGNLILESIDNNYTIPAAVWLKIQNKTDADVTLNTCEDIEINYAGQNLTFDPILSNGENFCKDIIVASSSTENIDYNYYYKQFLTAGGYTFKSSLGEKEYISQFNIENPGTIRKLFTTIFYAPIYNLLVFLTLLFSNSLGYWIIAITIVLRLLLIYPQHKMMLSQKKLQAIQPKIKEIQQKYKWQQQVLGMKLMELYKAEKVNPMGSIGFLLIQMTILLVMYNIILHIKDPSNFYYLYEALSRFDLQTVSYNFFGLELLESWGVKGAILAISVWIVQFIQIKLSLANKKNDEKKGVVLEKKKGDAGYNQFMPDPNMMNKFMLYGMPAMVVVFTYHLFAWVGLYWGISTLFMLFQQLIVNKK